MMVCLEGLDEQFNEKATCWSVLDYMAEYKGQKKLMFRNYLVLSHHVFDGLAYLQTVHRDIRCKLRAPNRTHLFLWHVISPT